ncbi:Predicted glutamine amidotransferase [Acidilobus saccharovorans 345-15]|uniref:Predicted glutamine amidotransferase n=1 Tax=Acidilobus saccharovorans (strain DSM 16705 / JCM 18335 / VKM B-2471 / 345-15) TaxID=666510 RepID=D9Q1D4_ACIS3|nr:class II glutamine amidotransferase [Acidilobus saccharovorans]ADL19122.1 Predicted glutamine amidotransferase [Acidilobus saccharovorans 345-15]
MCRMLGAASSSPGEVRLLVSCLARAAQRDVLRHDEVHGDGWGMAAYSREGLLVRRSARPIFDELSNANSLQLPAGEQLVMVHARAASDSSKVGIAYSHPYEALSADGRRLYLLAHNGSVDREGLGRALGLGELSGNYVDSELALMVIAREGLSEGALELLRNYTETALDLLIMEVDRPSGAARLYAYSYWRDPGEGEYYELRVISAGSTTAVVSSTVAKYCEALGLRHSGLGPGRLVMVGELSVNSSGGLTGFSRWRGPTP